VCLLCKDTDTLKDLLYKIVTARFMMETHVSQNIFAPILMLAGCLALYVSICYHTVERERSALLAFAL